MPDDRPTRRDAMPSLWRGVHELFQRIDSDIQSVYADLGIEGVRPRFSMALMFLADGPLTIRELAREVAVSHSAMSQTVSAMSDAGLIHSTQGTDARSRLIELTERGREVVPALRAEWDATEAVLADLEAETAYPLSQAARDIDAALDRQSFAARLSERMRQNP